MTIDQTAVDLSKNIGWANQNIRGQKVVKVINAWAFLNYWGTCPGCPPPKSTPVTDPRKSNATSDTNLTWLGGQAVRESLARNDEHIRPCTLCFLSEKYLKIRTS